MGCGASSTKKSGLEGLVLGANEDKQKHLSMWFQQQQAIYDDEAAAERQCYQNLLHFGKNDYDAFLLDCNLNERDVQVALNRFRKYDHERCGLAILGELSYAIGVVERREENLLGRLFVGLDVGRRGTIKFREFLVLLSYFSSLRPAASRPKFVFRALDRLDNGCLTFAEVKSFMMNYVWEGHSQRDKVRVSPFNIFTAADAGAIFLGTGTSITDATVSKGQHEGKGPRGRVCGMLFQSRVPVFSSPTCS